MHDLVLVHDPRYAGWVFDETHPTQGRRFTIGAHVVQRLQPGVLVLPPRQATRRELSLVHDPVYLSRLEHSHLCDEWRGPRPDLAELAVLFAGGTLVALRALLDGQALTAAHLPGAKHHAMRDHSSGFCVLADFAMAAKVAAREGHRVAILDIDAHHGDGTEALTYADPSVLTFSVHQGGIFPGTGMSSLPFFDVHNRPLPAGAGDAALLDCVRSFTAKARAFGASLVFVAGGADGHRTDPLSSLDYTFRGMASAMAVVREEFPGTPVLFGGAGGYQPDRETPLAWGIMVNALVTGRGFSTARPTPSRSARPRLVGS